MLRISLPDVEATEALGAALAHEVQKGDCIFLTGGLGVGKTSLARGFVRRFFGNPTLDVPSPSYLLHFEYSSKAPPQLGAPEVTSGSSDKASGKTFQASTSALVADCTVHHIDPYRLPEGKIAALMDFDHIFSNIALVEWPERLGDQLVKDDNPGRLLVCFDGTGVQAEGREVVLSGVGERWKNVVDRWLKEGGPLRSAPSDPAPAINGASHPSLATDAATETKPAAKRTCKALPLDPAEWRVLGIESSCDDTGAAILSGTGTILGEAIASQAGIHEKWGGVVPRLAQEAHKQAIDQTVEEALKRASIKTSELSAVAVTIGPGLSMCLEVGVRKALQIAAEHNLPVVKIHHMEAHTLVTMLPPTIAAGQPVPKPIAFPFITVLVSGGHNMSVLSRGIGRHTILGSSIDDSIGECFDKTARTLGITQIPGGPHLEKLAKEGDDEAHQLPRPLAKTRDDALRTGCDFSFSGLKTATRTLIEKEMPKSSEEDMPADDKQKSRANIAAAFQRTAVEHLCERVSRAVDWACELEPSIECMVVAGGVAANQTVRKGLTEVAASAKNCEGIEMRCPPPRLCVDNGVMVAWAGVERLRLGLYDDPPSTAGVELAVEIWPRWALGDRDSRSQAVSKGKEHKAAKRKQPNVAGDAGEPPAKKHG
eukprot:TRINITY_DN100919_c0_g1_i1.p1 TRINITY_DN100919_c0_g1~~TRINITY_DN100919_c0_g1_i1.p1  ORF type:complete len:654 (+),score=138.61 TRINITY_DN100919_c0_g1_i1:92-2053(+)